MHLNLIGWVGALHTEHDIIPNGTIAQLGERATEVRKVAGSIPARPIIFCIFILLYPCASIVIPNGTIAQLGERATEVRKVAGSIPARPITFLHLIFANQSINRSILSIQISITNKQSWIQRQKIYLCG
ncbi:hypothetical protein ACN42_g3488 [Penicillium freii]|uniref:Uncharacterized protein n=1 Tax=Penicillium freii TaxID=48697 RepID=A0A101MN60_PENFR|nr:hypothetical protein ACN42_g3488 [Penicillium freii]